MNSVSPLSQIPLKVAYLVNQYPKVSHSFIRREILSLESCGLDIARFSIRSCYGELVDEADKAEFKKTRVILDAGIVKFGAAFFKALLTRPARFLQALWLTVKLSRCADKGLLRHLVYLVEACVLLDWLHETAVNHLHVHFGTNSTTVALLTRTLGGPPYSFTVHGPEEFDKVITISLPEKIENAAFVIAISYFGKSQLYRWCRASDWPKVHLVHCGVDQDFLSQPFTPIPEVPQLVCVGRLCEQKGQLLLIEAVARLVSEGCQFKLVLVGDGPLRSDIETLIVKKNLQSAVTITGWASSAAVRQHILDARALVLPSFAEGLPVVLMEALALHRPVITTYVAGIPELVEHQVSGWLVPPGSIEPLAVAMRQALQAPVAALEEMGNLGAKKVAQQHSVVTETSKLLTLFKATITDPKRQKSDIALLADCIDV